MDPVASYLREAIVAGRMPGAAWAVDGPGGPLSCGAFGHAALEPERTPLEPDTMFDLGSLTKPLCTGLALVLLEQQGRVSLDAPIAEFLPELGGSPFSKVSLLQLAAHRGGLPAWCPLYLEANDPRSFLVAIAAQPRLAADTTAYSDLGYVCLGIAIERISGQPLDLWFAESIAAPLGRPDFGFATRVDASRAAATERGNAHEREMAGPAGAGHPWRTDMIRGRVHDGNADALGGVAGHAGLFGALLDVLSLAREVLRPQRLPLQATARARLLEEAIPGSGRTVGFVLAPASRAARGVFGPGAPGHVGFTGTSLWFEPDRGRAYVLLSNRVHPVVEAADFQEVRLGFHRAAHALN